MSSLLMWTTYMPSIGGQFFQLKSSIIQVYDMSGTRLRAIPYPSGTCYTEDWKQGESNVIHIIPHKDEILLAIRGGGIRVLDIQDGKQIRFWPLPEGDGELVSIQGRLYSSHLEKQLIHEISDHDGSCLRTIQVQYTFQGDHLAQVRVLGALYDELYVCMATEGAANCNDRIHAYSRSTGQFLRSIVRDINFVTLLPTGYMIVEKEKRLFLMD